MTFVPGHVLIARFDLSRGQRPPRARLVYGLVVAAISSGFCFDSASSASPCQSRAGQYLWQERDRCQRRRRCLPVGVRRVARHRGRRGSSPARRCACPFFRAAPRRRPSSPVDRRVSSSRGSRPLRWFRRLGFASMVSIVPASTCSGCASRLLQLARWLACAGVDGATISDGMTAGTIIMAISLGSLFRSWSSIAYAGARHRRT